MGWRRGLLTAAGLAAAVWAMAAADCVLRARSAYLEGEKWLSWHADPKLKAAHFDAELAARLAAVDAEVRAGKTEPAAAERKRLLARFERDQAVAESSVKYAFVWFQTAAELFARPDNPWARKARVRMAEAKELWKKELDARKVPYRDYMLE
jgi:hypothetical protein